MFATWTSPTVTALRMASVGFVTLGLMACSSSRSSDGGVSDGGVSDGNQEAGTDASSVGMSARMVVSCGTVCSRPLDAVPSSDGVTIFFTALVPEGGGGVFKVASMGGPITLLAMGLEFPAGIAISKDDTVLYIADQSASRESGGDDTGVVYRISATGGSVMPIDLGNELVRPGALTVTPDGADLLISATRASDSQPALFRVPVGGGSATAVAADLADPSGVSVAPDGTILVHDTVRGGEKSATAVTVMGNVTVPLAGGLVAGYPAGLAHSMDGSGVLFSGSIGGQGGLLTWSSGGGAVTNPVSLSAGMVQPLGLHRARGRNLWAIADEEATESGAIFVVE